MSRETIEAAAATIGSKSTYAGAGASIAGWLTSSEATVVMGLVLGVLGLAVNWYYKHKADKRAEAEHARRMGFYE